MLTGETERTGRKPNAGGGRPVRGVRESRKGNEGDNDTYNKTYLRAQRNYRYQLLNHLLGLTPTTEEKDLWDEIMEELD